MNVTVYSTTHCGVCHAEMQWLSKNNITYQEKIVDQNEAYMIDFLSINDGMIGTPFTTIEVGEEVTKIAGFDQKKLKKALNIS